MSENVQLMPTFGVRLRAARTTAGLSQAEVTRLSGVPKTMLSRYENDHILPSISTLQKIARAIGVRESSLLGERPVLDVFTSALRDRGIEIATEQDEVTLAQIVVDMVDAGDNRVRFLESVEEEPA